LKQQYDPKGFQSTDICYASFIKPRPHITDIPVNRKKERAHKLKCIYCCSSTQRYEHSRYLVIMEFLKPRIDGKFEEGIGLKQAYSQTKAPG